jgi:beta-lactamase regulating signal transducer with metallopeptidase domain
MTPAAQALNTALLHFIWQGIAVGVGLGIALMFLKRSTPRARYAASCIAMLVLALAPVITGIRAYHAPLSVSSSQVVSADSQTSSDPVLANPTMTFISEQATYDWILPIWAAGVLVFALRFVWAGGYAYALRRGGVDADGEIYSIVARVADRLRVRRRVRVLVSSVAEVPSVVGWIRPLILLPAAVLVGLSPYQLEALLAHELAHIRRHDYLVNMVQMFVETLFFYQPAVWWISSRIRYERELCCDDLAVSSSGDAVAYARALAQLERLRPAMPSLAMGSTEGPVFHRVQRLLGIRRIENGPSKLACAIGLLVGILCLSFFMSTAKAQEQQPPRVQFSNDEVKKLLEELRTQLFEAFPATPIPPEPPLQSPAPLPPAPPVPPILEAPEVLPVAPQAPAPPIPPEPPALALLGSRLQAVRPAEDVRWVLFSGNDVKVQGTDADEAEARKARAPFNGDLLWFRLNGKTYITQDAQTIESFRTSTRPSDAGALMREFVKAEQQAMLSNQQRALTKLKQAEANLDRVLNEVNRAEPGKSRSELQAQLNVALAENASAKAATERQLVDLETALMKLSTDYARVNKDTQTPGADILRDAIQSGKARETP